LISELTALAAYFLTLLLHHRLVHVYVLSSCQTLWSSKVTVTEKNKLLEVEGARTPVPHIASDANSLTVQLPSCTSPKLKNSPVWIENPFHHRLFVAISVWHWQLQKQRLLPPYRHTCNSNDSVALSLSYYVIVDDVIVVAIGLVFFCHFMYDNLFCFFSLPLSVCLVYASLFLGSLCVYLFGVFLASSFI